MVSMSPFHGLLAHALEPTTSMVEECGEEEVFPNKQEAALKKGSGGVV